MRKEDLRPCVAWNFDKAECEDGYFHGWFQFLEGNLDYGVNGGAYGIFEDKYGCVRTVSPTSIRFTDREKKQENERDF